MYQLVQSLVHMGHVNRANVSAIRVMCWMRRGNTVYHIVRVDVELGESVWRRILANVVKGE